MAKSKRTRRAKNKIAGSAEGALINARPTTDPAFEAAISVGTPSRVWIVKDSLFTADLEEAIDIIARDRVYRAMLARLGYRRLNPPTTGGEIFDT